MSELTAVIPAAGRGTRLYPLTYAVPKEMLPLGPKPTIQLVVEELLAAGVKEFVVVTAKSKAAIADHFTALADRDETYAGLSFRYVMQAEPRGLGDAVLCAAEAVESDFVIALGDAVLWGEPFGGVVTRMLQVARKTGAKAVVAAQEVTLEETRRFGVFEPAEPGPLGSLRTLDLVEKPGPEKAPSRLAVCARYVLSPMVFDLLRTLDPGHGGEIQLTDALRRLAQEHLAYAVPLQPGEERWDVGSLSEYGEAFAKAWQAQQSGQA